MFELGNSTLPELEKPQERQHVIGRIVVVELAVIITILLAILHEVEELERKDENKG
ncbi:hypothetical protein [Desulfitobacterium sp.]|uniref:hypothetical protein n=1 Tax=Desulfitobacterium sp. TaxID=49981 RepID=UPI002C7C6DEC|nr:hypothetical protein [Desulfitobacterium sp.]HVJ48641.1 hypothetical protein [Desulfitobacterium sp.]